MSKMTLAAGALVALAAVAFVEAQSVPSAPASDTSLNFSATSANVKESGTPVKIKLLRWSTDEERTPLLAALSAPARPAAPPPAAAQAGGAAGQGGAAAGRGAARGRGGRGGRGDAPPLTPIEAFAAALGRAPTLGYIWTNDVTGYSIKYAYRASLPDGGERIILASDRRLGAYSPGWKPTVQAPPTDYEFTVIEMRLNAKGTGEGKTSLTTKVVVDNEAKTIALEDYAGAPAIFQNVKR